MEIKPVYSDAYITHVWHVHVLLLLTCSQVNYSFRSHTRLILAMLQWKKELCSECWIVNGSYHRMIHSQIGQSCRWVLLYMVLFFHHIFQVSVLHCQDNRANVHASHLLTNLRWFITTTGLIQTQLRRLPADNEPSRDGCSIVFDD